MKTLVDKCIDKIWHPANCCF